jgi:hypothetical protein
MQTDCCDLALWWPVYAVRCGNRSAGHAEPGFSAAEAEQRAMMIMQAQMVFWQAAQLSDAPAANGSRPEAQAHCMRKRIARKQLLKLPAVLCL